MSEEKQVLEIEEQEAIAKALIMMIQQCPFVESQDITTRYEDLNEDYSLGVFAKQGTVYSKRFITGSFQAQYVFFIGYRIKPTNDQKKINAEEFLSAIAKWLEGQKVTYGGVEYLPPAYPALSDNREILRMERTTDAFAATSQQSGTVDYQVHMKLEYQKRRQ